MKRFLALVLSLLFVMTLLPTAALAVDPAITSLAIVGPAQKYYVPGETVDTSAVTVTANKADKSSEDVTSECTLDVGTSPGSGETVIPTTATPGSTVKLWAAYKDADGGDHTASTDLNVVAQYLKSIALDPAPAAETSLALGESLSSVLDSAAKLELAYYDGVGQTEEVLLTDSRLSWSPSITSAVDSAAIATGTKSYTVTLTDSAYGNGSISKTYTFTAIGTPVAAMSLNESSLDLLKGTSSQLETVFTPTGATDGVTWKSSNTKVATVSSSGLVAAVGAGAATITATTKKAKDTSGVLFTASCAVTVSAAPISASTDTDYASLALSLSEKVYINGQNFDLTTLTVKGLLSNEDGSGGKVIAPADYSVKVSLTKTSSTYYNGAAAIGPTFNSTGTATVTVRYAYVNSAGKSKTITGTKNVSVVASKPLEVQIVTNPKMMTYYYGEKLDTTGLTIKIANTKDGTTVSDYGTQTLADCYIPGLTDAITEDGTTGNDTHTYTIEYTDNKGIKAKSAELVVNVAKALALDALDVDETELEFEYAAIASGAKQSFTLTLPAGTPASAVAWQNSNSKVASYTYSTSGDVTTVNVQALQPGTTKISIRARGTTDVIKYVTVKVKGDPAAVVTGMKLNVNSYEMFVDTTYALFGVFTPITSTADIEWSIVEGQASTSAAAASGASDGVIDDAKFIKDGTIKALIKGTVELKGTVLDADGTPTAYTDTCVITVTDIAIDSVTLGDSSLTMFAGSGYTITGTVKPDNATDKTIAWTSSDESSTETYVNAGADKKISEMPIITITQIDANSGRIETNYNNFNAYCEDKGVTKYTGYVTAIVSGGKTAKCTITVKKGTLMTDLSLDKHSIELAIGETSSITATITPKTASNKTLTWTSSKPAVATVDESGNIKALTAGSTVVTCASNDGSGKTDTCVVQVMSILAKSITISPYVNSIAEEGTVQLTANLFPGNITSTKVAWSSNDEDIAKVDANGLVTGTGGGIAVIRASSTDGSNIYGSAVVSVKAKIAAKSVNIKIDDFELLLGDSTVLALSFNPSDATNTATTWKSSDSTVATIDKDGKIVGIKLGETNITGTAGGKSDTITVSVVSTLTKSGKVINCKRRVNVRAAASGTSKSLGYAYLGTRYKVLGQVGNWYKIQYSASKVGYIWANYLEVKAATASYTSSGAIAGTTPTTTTTPTTNPTKVTITNCVEFVNVRTGPGTSHTKLGTANLGTTYAYLATEGEWIKLTYNAQIAYIYKDYCLLS